MWELELASQVSQIYILKDLQEEITSAVCFSLPECLWGWIILCGEGRTNIDINIMLLYLASETLGNWKICALELGKNPSCLIENK